MPATYSMLGREAGESYLRHIRNMVFRPRSDETFFVEPWEHRDRRDCALFRNQEKEGTLEIVFATTDVELIALLDGAPTELHLYGAYNQITVCQMRALGWVLPHPPTGIDTERLRELILSKLVGTSKDDPPQERLYAGDIEDRVGVVRTGRIFTFVPHSYAYAVYERG